MGKRFVEKMEANEITLHQIELNSEGDYIVISGDDPELYDKFVAGYKQLMDAADGIKTQIGQIEKQYEGRPDMDSVMNKTIEVSRVNVGFSNMAVSVIDGIFGEGTVRKRFREAYEEIPDFLPDASCIMDFFEKIIPITEKVFDRKIKKDEELRKQRMKKYQPRDHKKPAGRRTGSKK